jgi:hypothetical protein
MESACDVMSATRNTRQEEFESTSASIFYERVKIIESTGNK